MDLFDPGAGATPIPSTRLVMPFSAFPEDDRYRIADEVMSDKRPKQWKHFDIGVRIPSRAWYEWHWHRGINPDRHRRLESWLRETVIERDGFVCQLCREAVDPSDIHIDHILPVSLGGRDTVDNLQVTHSLCNLRKGARV